MTKEEKIFVIDQLRKDKIIYATESVATSLASILGIIASDFFPASINQIVLFGSLTIGIGYPIFMGIGNYYRLIKIKELEKELNLEI